MGPAPWRYTLAGAVAAIVVAAALTLLLTGSANHRTGGHARGAGATRAGTTSGVVNAHNGGVGVAGAAGATAGATTTHAGESARATGSTNAGGGTSAVNGDSHAGGNGTRAVRGGSHSAGTIVAEVRDPEESKSFPLPATVHHASASSPSVAAEAVVAPGAASNAEVRRELGEEEHAEAQERAARQRILTPVAGGFSVGGNGTIPIPSGVPEVVQRVIAGGNAIADFPYIWGGGHASFIANGYDCSGSVSYALAAGGLLAAPLVSGELAHWGDPGPGRWITIYANAGHTFMDVNGVWFDTAGRSGPYASRWLVSTPPLEGYAVRHPPGF